MTKILLVEDDKSLREIYGVRLLAEGYDIVTAGDGEEALAMAIKERPNLIISDVMMPKISGFDMLDILKSTTETRGIKVIMMTALSSEDQRSRGESLGADRYLVKSQVGIEDVIKTVHDVLGDGHLTPEQRTADKSMPTASPEEAVQNQTTATISTPQTPNQATSVTPAPQASSGELFSQDSVSRSQSQPIIPRRNIARAPGAQPMPEMAQPTAQRSPQPQRPMPAQSNAELPRPIAPFSTDRPASLGERVINPPARTLADEVNEHEFAAKMDNILNSTPSGDIDPREIIDESQPATTPAPQPAQPQPIPVQQAPQTPAPQPAPQQPVVQPQQFQTNTPQPAQPNPTAASQTSPDGQPTFGPQ